MKRVGKVITFNGYYGQIIDKEGKVDFSKQDISNDSIPTIGDVVLFRKEKKEANIALAKNIKVLRKIK